jgi:hypothetical protein
MLDLADGTAKLRRLAGWALVAGLCVSAAVAIVALLTDHWSDLSSKVVGTSLGFSVFTCTAAAGAALRLRAAGWAQALGAATIGSSTAAFGLLVLALWVDDVEWLWRGFGVAALASLWTSHASLMLRALRSDDTVAVSRLTAVSIVALAIDTSIGVVAVVGALEEVDDWDPIERWLSVLLVVTLLSTALPPILRRLQRRPPPSAFGAPPRAGGFAGEVAEVAARLDAMDLPPRARAEVDRLRELARNAGD